MIIELRDGSFSLFVHHNRPRDQTMASWQQTHHQQGITIGRWIRVRGRPHWAIHANGDTSVIISTNRMPEVYIDSSAVGPAEGYCHNVNSVAHLIENDVGGTGFL